MNETEAKKKAEKKNDNFMRENFCPLSRDMCRADCKCWEKYRAYMTDSSPLSGEQTWYITGGCCDCYMLVGGG